jgi:NADPH2:quinone reductase
MASLSIPTTMKGVIITKTGGTEVLEYKTDLPVPTPKAGQVLVKNDFIGVNFIDTCVYDQFPPYSSRNIAPSY